MGYYSRQKGTGTAGKPAPQGSTEGTPEYQAWIKANNEKFGFQDAWSGFFDASSPTGIYNAGQTVYDTANDPTKRKEAWADAADFKHDHLDPLNVVGDPGNIGGYATKNGAGGLITTDYANGRAPGPATHAGGATPLPGEQGGPTLGGSGSGDQKAAIAQAAVEAKALGQEQRGWFMGANDKAQGYYGPATTALGNQAANAPTQSRDAYGQIAPGLGNNTYQEDLAQNPGYATSPGAVGSYYGQQSGQRGPSQVQDLYGQQAGSKGPSQSRDYFGQQQTQLAGPGAAEQNATKRLAGGIQPGALDQRYGQAQSFAAGPDAVTQRYQQRQAGPQTGTLDSYASGEIAKGGPTSTKGVFDDTNSSLAGKTYSENLLGSQKYGTDKTDVENLYSQRVAGGDPAANYEDTRAIEAINNQLAARGRFNSGPGVRQISDYLANAGAQRSHQMADLATASSSAAGSRAGYMSGLAGQSDTTRLAATGLRGDLAKASDATDLAGRSYLGGLAKDVDANQLQRQGQIDTLAGQTSASGLARQGMLNGLAGNVDDSKFRQQTQLDTLAQNSQDQQRQRIALGGTLAGQASGEESGQRDYLAGLAASASGEQSTHDKYLADLAKATGAEDLGKANYGLDAAKGADASRLANNTLQGNLAGQASGEQRNYYGDLTDKSLDVGKAQASTMQDLYTTGGKQYNDDTMAGIEAKMKAAGINTSGMDMSKLIELAIKYGLAS